VRGLEQVQAAKTLQVLLVEAPAVRLIRLGRPDFAREQGPDQGLVVGLALVGLPGLRQARPIDSMPRRGLQQQLADDQCPRRRRACFLDRARRMILQLGADRVLADLDAVDEHRHAQTPSLARLAFRRTI
jgi:hypothetical protein